MSRRHANIWSHPSHNLVNHYTWPSDHFWLRYSKFHIWTWKFTVKVMSKVKLNCHIWGLKFIRYVCFSFHGNRTIFGWDIANSIFDLENSRSRSNTMVTLRPWVQSICFLFFRGNRTIFGWDIANSMFDLENSRSRSWPSSNPMVTFEALSSIDMFPFRFVAIRLFLA